MPIVYNIKAKHLVNALYIGRGSICGNPFKIGKDGTRDEVCDKYEAYLEANPVLKAAIIKLCHGRDLLCYCKPARCHGDYILKIANGPNESEAP